MSSYMRGQFPFFGIKSPLRKALSRQLIRELGAPQGDALKTLCREGFGEPEREIHYFVCELLARQMRRLDPSFLLLVEELVQRKSWWDTVDILAPRVAGSLLLRFPDEKASFPDRWIKEGNIWLRRSALIFQLSYREKTDAGRLFQYALQSTDSGEFFVQKAAGWALRQYARTEPGRVQEFIADNPQLPALTRREGLKHLRNGGKKPR